jgi:hypothetical protein
LTGLLYGCSVWADPFLFFLSHQSSWGKIIDNHYL